MKHPRPLAEIEPLALDIYQALKPHCETIKIAGSIRRRKEEVGDIELVSVPWVETFQSDTQQLGLFGEATSNKELIKVRVPGFNEAVRRIGRILAGDKIERMVKIDYAGIQVDLFITNYEDFGRQLAIRTGPFNYSKDVIAVGWNRRGWVGTDDGLRKRKQCEKKSGKWYCKTNDPDLPPPFYTEEDFFEFIRVKYQEPKYRK